MNMTLTAAQAKGISGNAYIARAMDYIYTQSLSGSTEADFHVKSLSAIQQEALVDFLSGLGYSMVVSEDEFGDKVINAFWGSL